MSGRTISIRYSLARNLMLMILATSGAILLVSHAWSSRVVSRLSSELIVQKLDRTEQELQRFFMPVHNGLLMFREWGRAGLLEQPDLAALGTPGQDAHGADRASLERLDARFAPVLRQFPHVTSLMIASSDGEEYMLLRQPDHWISRVSQAEVWKQQTFWLRRELDGAYSDAHWRALDYDPRRRPWFRGALGAGDDLHWTEPYRFFTTKAPGITASLRWADPDDPTRIHVIAFDVKLIDLSRFTTGFDISENGKVLILTDDRRAVGLPRDARFVTDAALTEHVLTPVDRLDTPEIVAAVRTVREQGIQPGQVFFFTHAGETFWAGSRLFPLGEHTLRIAVVIPERDFLAGAARQQRIVFGVTAGALVVAFFLSIVLARRYSDPLAALAGQAERIRRLDIGPSEPIHSRLREVEQLASTQDRMLTALDSFSRYVPIDVVRELMKHDEAAQIGGAPRTITILFTDIQGFTTIAERLGPAALTSLMSEYFDAMLGTVQDDGFGTVTQLAGDGFVAFWGAPIPGDQHAAHAAEGVLRCRERLAELNRDWIAQGLPALPTRFGLATGPVVVGNVGSPARLVYTAVGDTINLASRLEGLNRFYGTWVLASDAVRDAAGDAFEWRRLDRVRAKGKETPIELYELLGRRGDVDAERMRFASAYEQALGQYQDRDFASAIAILEQIPAERRDDLSVVRLCERARALLSRPPAEDWDGVTVFDEK